MADQRKIVICGAGAIGASVAYFLTRRGETPVIVDRAGPAAAASGRAAGFLALDWCANTPLDALARASFALHREIADELGHERLGYRPMGALMTAAADEGDLEQYRTLPNPEWLDGNVVAHDEIGSPQTTAQIDPRLFTTALVEESVAAGATLVEGTIEGLRFDERGAVSGVEVDGRTLEADRVVLALGPWTAQAQRWVALPQVFGTKSVSLVLAAAAPAQAVFSEFISRTKQRYTIELYPRSGDAVYVSGFPEHGALPDDPREIVPSDAGCEELQRIAGVHARALADAPVRARSACFRPLTVDGVPLIGPVEGADGVLVATGHASWGILNAPATGRMVAEMLLDGGSRSVDATPFSPARLPAGRI